jgi:NAD(P)-dependent dehydrogenase (short-subunit alcohol dehydrogenase family)
MIDEKINLEKPNMRLKDKVAMITGAASGMGASTAKIFAAEGARVLCLDMDDQDGEAVVGIITRAGGTARFQHLDVSSEEQWKAAVDAVLAAWGTIDVLVNNAGVSGSDPDRLSLAVWEQQMTINARGVFLGIRAVVPVMQKAKRGSIINTSSISGIVGQVFVHMGYNAAKGAIRSMTKAAAVQFAGDNIRVNSVHPGMLPPMRTSKLSADPNVRAVAIAAVPMKREGRVEEVAYANLFLASDEASYITGVELAVDGGYLAQ